MNIRQRQENQPEALKTGRLICLLPVLHAVQPEPLSDQRNAKRQAPVSRGHERTGKLRPEVRRARKTYVPASGNGIEVPFG